MRWVKIGLIRNVKNLLIGKPYDPGIYDIPVSEWESLYESYSDTHLRQSALDTVLGKIKNTSNLIVFDTKDDKLNYRLNVKANDNDNKIDFRNKVIDQMLLEGEALVIIHNNNFYVADSFTVNDTVFGEKVYENVVVENLAMRKHYYSNQVFHFRYINDKLKRFLNSLDDSYAKLFQRLIEVHMRNNQIRFYASFAGVARKDSDSQEKFKEFLYGLEGKIRNDSVAIIPTQKDYDINENAQSYESRSITEVGDLENMYIRQVANILQVPPLLFSGDLADVTVHNEMYIKHCIRPLMETVASEVNAKYFNATEYKANQHVRVNSVFAIYNSEFEMAKDAEKMIGSGVWTVDDVLELQGKQRINSKVTTQRYLTKNIAPISEDGTIADE